MPRKHPRRAACALTLLLCSALLVACGGDAETRVEEGNRLGVLHIGNGTEPQGIDPHITSGTPEYQIMQSLFEGLVMQDPYTLEILPAGATHWDVSDDGRVYRFQLRPEARWSNGDPVTAEDYRWSIERAMTPALGNDYQEAFSNLVGGDDFFTGKTNDFSSVGVRVIDDLTLEIELVGPDLTFLTWLDQMPFFPVHRATIEKFGTATDRLSQWTRVGNFVGNGPFTLVEWQVNSHIRVEPNPYYWGVDDLQLNAIVFYAIEDSATEERMFRDGQLHLTRTVPLEKVATYRQENPEVLRLEPLVGSYFYILNTGRPPLDDLRVRQALNHATDRELIVATVMDDTVFANSAYVPLGLPGYQSPDWYEFDPDRARELLAQAGYPGGEGFPRLTILYNTLDAHRKIATAIQQMWKETLNIDIALQNQEWKVFLDTIAGKDYDIGRKGWLGSVPDPIGMLQAFVSTSGNNDTGFGDPRFDEIVTRDGLWASDLEQRNQLAAEAEAILRDAAPIVPLYTYSNRRLVDPSVQGLPGNWTDYFNYRFVSLKSSGN